MAPAPKGRSGRGHFDNGRRVDVQGFFPPRQDLQLAARRHLVAKSQHAQHQPSTRLVIQRQEEEPRHRPGSRCAVRAKVDLGHRRAGEDLLHRVGQKAARFRSEETAERQTTDVEPRKLGQARACDADLCYATANAVGEENPVQDPHKASRIDRLAQRKRGTLAQAFPIGAGLGDAVDHDGKGRARLAPKSVQKSQGHLCPHSLHTPLAGPLSAAP